MTKHTLSEDDLGQFTGSEHWYRHGLIRSVSYTDGAQYAAEHGGAYWLLALSPLRKSMTGLLVPSLFRSGPSRCAAIGEAWLSVTTATAESFTCRNSNTRIFRCPR
jgi:hypothetical protein